MALDNVNPTDSTLKAILDNILEVLPHPIFWKDRNHVFLGCNSQFSKEYGFDDPKQLIGKTDYDLPFSKSFVKQIHHDDDQICHSGVPKINYEEQQHQPDGSIKTVLVSKVPLTVNEEIVGVLGIYSDITQLKELQNIKEENKLQAERINTLKLLAASMAHELRTPIAAIKAGVSGLAKFFPRILQAFKDNPPANDTIRPIHLHALSELPNSLINLTDSCHQIIDIQLKNISTDNINTSSFNRHSMYQDVMQAIKQYPISSHDRSLLNINFTKDNDFDYWGDSLLTIHMIWNLIKNAFYYVKEVSKGDITITLVSQENENLLIIEDTGRGIPPDELEKIYNTFYTKRPFGTGLGLSFCKQVMDFYGGKIYCDSKENQYTRFTLAFPKYNENHDS